MGCAIKVICNNKKAYHNYFISETYEAGIQLVGSEVKSVKSGGVSINDAFIYIKNNEVYLKNAYIKPYEKTSVFSHNELRNRKLLLHDYEIAKLVKQVDVKGFTLVPIKVYLKNGLIKLELGLAKGKKLYDKREVLKQKTINSQLQRELKNC